MYKKNPRLKRGRGHDLRRGNREERMTALVAGFTEMLKDEHHLLRIEQAVGRSPANGTEAAVEVGRVLEVAGEVPQGLALRAPRVVE